MHQKRLAYGLAAVAFAAVATAEADSKVVQLTEATFDDFINTNSLVLAEFFAPWCGHCKALAPEYEKAADSLSEKNVAAKLAKIDCTEESALCQKHGVEGYPTLKIFRGLDVITAYNGQRKAKDIHDYMERQSKPAVSSLDKDTLESFKKMEEEGSNLEKEDSEKAHKVVIVAYVAANDKASNEAFAEVAKKLRDEYSCGSVNDAAVAKAEGVEIPSVVLYKSFDEGKEIFKDKFDAEAIQNFVKKAATPLVGEIGPDTYAKYMSAGVPLAYIFFEKSEDSADQKGFEPLDKIFRPIAEKFKGKINFAKIDAKQFGPHAGNLNLDTKRFPSFAIQDVTNGKKYPFDQDKEFSYDNIAKFVQDFDDGKIEASIKSEPIPEKQEGPVAVVVAKNYEKIVLDDTKDVLIEFYAPWCGHCKALAPKYEELAAQYATSEFKDKVVIAKVDATANDVPDDVSGFPTIKLYPAGGKNAPATYSGSRTVEDIVNFIKENGKYKAGISVKEEGTEEATPSSTDAAEEDLDEEDEKELDHDEL